MEVTWQEGLDEAVARLVRMRWGAVRQLARHFGLPEPARGEAGRIAALKRQAVAPEGCGPEMPLAPARGRLVPVAPIAMVRAADGYVPQHVGFAGRDAARAADVWDRMAAQAARAGGEAPFTVQQVATGRAYAALVERHAAFGLRGRSVEVLAGRGGGASDGVMDAVIDEGRRIAAMERAAGGGMALAVRRQRGAGRSGVPVLALVRAVAVDGLDLSAVLRRYGWAAQGPNREAAREALAAALDRMGAACGGLTH